MIAFHNEPIILTGRSIDSVLLRSSLPVPALKLKTKNIKNYGKATLKYNTDIKGDLPIAIQPKEILHYTEVLGDSLGIYHETPLRFIFHICRKRYSESIAQRQKRMDVQIQIKSRKSGT